MFKYNTESVNRKLFVFMFLSVYLFSLDLRKTLIGKLADINIIFLVLLIIYMYLHRKRINLIKFIYITFIYLYIFLIDYFQNGNSIITIIRSTFMTIVPLYILCVNIKENEIKSILKKSLEVINIFTIIIFFIGILDPLLNFKIMKFFSLYLVPSLAWTININTNLISYRYTSYMGHALFTKELFIYFYLLNMVYYKKMHESLININIIKIISIIGVLLTGSKVGIVLIIISLIFSADRGKKLKNTLGVVIIIIAAYFMGLFKTLVYRLANESLTTGRYAATVYMKQNNFIKYHIFTGYGEYVDRILGIVANGTIVTALLEYPVRIIFLKYGILCGLLMIFIIFIYPILYFAKKKEWYILFAFLIKVVDINTYNGLIFKGDNMILFMLFTVLLIGATNLKGEN